MDLYSIILKAEEIKTLVATEYFQFGGKTMTLATVCLTIWSAAPPLLKMFIEQAWGSMIPGPVALSECLFGAVPIFDH